MRKLRHLSYPLKAPTLTFIITVEVKAPEFMEGRSPRPHVEGCERKWRDELFRESLFYPAGQSFPERHPDRVLELHSLE